jgi:DNA-binding beta-propeller fold protein YncE
MAPRWIAYTANGIHDRYLGFSTPSLGNHIDERSSHWRTQRERPMNSIFFWKRGFQSAAVGAAVLLSGCHSSALPPQLGAGLQSHVAPAQVMGQRAPVIRSTPLPTYLGLVRSAGTFSPSAGKAYLYIADAGLNQIDIFPMKGEMQPQVGTITAGIDGPYGLWFDRRAQELYVANQSNNTVTVYPYGSTQPTRTYSQSLNRPLYPIVDSHGELYVGNANDGTVVEYLAGTTNVHQVLQTAGTEADGMALDKYENLYVAYRTNGIGSIEEFAPGATQGQILGMTLDEPQGVVVVPRGTIVATETGGTNRVDVFRPGSKTESLEVPMPGGSVATELAIDCHDEFLYVSGLYSGIVFGVNYPLRGQSLFVKDQAPALIQGATITNNQNF